MKSTTYALCPIKPFRNKRRRHSKWTGEILFGFIIKCERSRALSLASVLISNYENIFDNKTHRSHIPLAHGWDGVHECVCLNFSVWFNFFFFVSFLSHLLDTQLRTNTRASYLSLSATYYYYPSTLFNMFSFSPTIFVHQRKFPNQMVFYIECERASEQTRTGVYTHIRYVLALHSHYIAI